jgi:hypothetical protein
VSSILRTSRRRGAVRDGGTAAVDGGTAAAGEAAAAVGGAVAAAGVALPPAGPVEGAVGTLDDALGDPALGCASARAALESSGFSSDIAIRPIER